MVLLELLRLSRVKYLTVIENLNLVKDCSELSDIELLSLGTGVNQ